MQRRKTFNTSLWSVAESTLKVTQDSNTQLQHVHILDLLWGPDPDPAEFWIWGPTESGSVYLENCCCSDTICARPSSDSSVTSRRRFSLSSRKRRSSSNSWISFSRCGHKKRSVYLLKEDQQIISKPGTIFILCGQSWPLTPNDSTSRSSGRRR